MYELIHGDSLKIMQGFSSGKFHLIITDPPYFAEVRGGINTGVGKGWKAAHNYFKPITDFRPYYEQMHRVLRPDAHCYVFTNTASLELLLVQGKRYFQLVEVIPMIKRNCYPVNKYWLRNTELILMFQKGRRECNHMDWKNVLYADLVSNDPHPTVKPINVLGKLIKQSSLAEEAILDPFTGSGTTGVAAIRLGRYFTGIEIDEQHYKTATINLANELNPQQMRLI